MITDKSPEENQNVVVYLTDGKYAFANYQKVLTWRWLARLVRWLWSLVSCWNCGKFGGRHDCLVERQPDGLHDRWMLCSHCAGKPFSELQQELYPPNAERIHGGAGQSKQPETRHPTARASC